MVQILDRPKSTRERFSEAFSNAGRALPSALGGYYEAKGKEGAAKQKQQEAQDKKMNALSGYIAKELKSRRLDTFSDTDFEDLRNRIAPLVASGMAENEAFERALGEFRGARQEEGFGRESPLVRGPASRRADEGKVISGILGKGLEDFERDPFGGPFRSLLAPDPEELRRKTAGLIEEPKSSALGLLGGLGTAFENLSGGSLDRRVKELLGKKTGMTVPGETEKQRLQRQAVEPSGQLIGELAQPLGPLAGIVAKPVSKAGSFAKNILSKFRKPAVEAGEALAKEAPAIEKSLVGRVGKQELTPTEMRIERAKPREKLYPTAERVSVKEQQIKNFPKYASEIEADAAKRAEQAYAREPKTVKGRDSRRLRQVEAEKVLPKAQDSYYKSAGRVRALEDEFAKLPSAQQAEMKPILELAKKDLQDATFNLKQASENLKGISYRANVDEMKSAARKKLMDIQDTVAKGEDYALAKMDYSPDLIKEAKRISTNKPLPYSPKEDFYRDVHRVYADEYRTRIGQIEKEIQQLAKEPSLSSIEARRSLGKEKDIINKMIESAEAERTIHRHKFGLREMSERAKAKERIAQFKKMQDQPKVRQAAQEKMWKRRMTELKSPEGRRRMANEIVEDAAKEAKTPQQAEKIRAEKTQFEDALDKVSQKKEALEVKLSTGAKTPEEAKTRAARIIKDFEDMVEGLRKGGLEVFKTRLGKDIAWGIGAAVWDNLRKEYDIPFTGASLAVAFGRGGSYRVAVNQLTKHLMTEYRISQAEKAYREHDEKKFAEYTPKVRKEAKQRASKRV